MTPQDLIAAFDTLAEAPSAADRLRELILQLAVRGKLVPQDPDDVPATTLIDQIAEKKAGLVKAGHIRKVKPPASISEAEFPYDLPPGWAWARIEQLCVQVTDGVHQTPKYVTEGVPFLSIKDISGGSLDFSNTRLITPEQHAEINARCNPKRGDILFCRIGTLGRALVVDTDRAFSLFVSVGLIQLTGDLDPEFLRVALNSPFAYDQYDRIKAGGSHTVKLNLGTMRNALMPLAPRAEQSRIVERVDELMGLLDRLEAARDAREATRAALRDSALAALQQADTHEEVETAWRRIADNIHDLFTNPADIEPLRQTILQLAVRGRLVPQDPDDEPAGVMLERIDRERELLIAQKRARKRPLPAPVTELNGLPSLPTGWRWGRLGNLLFDIEAGWSPSAYKRPKENDEWGVLKVSACSWGKFLPNENKALRPGTKPRVELEVRKGDFLISRANTRELVARSVLVDECPSRLMLSDKTLRLHVAPPACAAFVNLANLSRHTRDHYEAEASGTSASMRNVSQDVIWNAPIPIPPEREQQRIVARFDELMGLVDDLQQHLAAQRDVHDAFAAAAIHHLET